MIVQPAKGARETRGEQTRLRASSSSSKGTRAHHGPGRARELHETWFSILTRPRQPACGAVTVAEQLTGC